MEVGQSGSGWSGKHSCCWWWWWCCWWCWWWGEVMEITAHPGPYNQVVGSSVSGEEGSSELMSDRVASAESSAHGMQTPLFPFPSALMKGAGRERSRSRPLAPQTLCLPRRAAWPAGPHWTSGSAVAHYQNTRTPKHQNTRTPEHQNTKTPTHQNTNTPTHQNRGPRIIYCCYLH